MPDPQRLSRIIDAAIQYYEEDSPKTNVAESLRTSVTEVNRLLEDAKALGFVRIEVIPPEIEYLQRRLKSVWNLKHGATVIPHVDNYRRQRAELGRAAGIHFIDCLRHQGGKKIAAVSGGETMFDMASAIKRIDFPVVIVPTALIGRGGKIDHADPASIITLLFEKDPSPRKSLVEANLASVLPFKGPPGSRVDMESAIAQQKRFLEFARVDAVHEQMLKADVVYSGVGLLEDSGSPARQDAEAIVEDRQTPVLRFLGEFGITAEELTKAGAVGDINYSFFDSRGRPLPDYDVFLSLTVTRLKEMVQAGKHVVLTAGHKPAAVRACLLGGLVSHLITDASTAETLL